SYLGTKALTRITERAFVHEPPDGESEGDRIPCFGGAAVLFFKVVCRACFSVRRTVMSWTAEQLKRIYTDEKTPATYRHVTVTKLGGPEVLQILEDKLPQPGPGAVRVRILAAGLSLPDLFMREGVHPEKHPPPFTPGWDLVGVVDQLG